MLSEKPLSFTKKESEVLYTSAKEKGVVLMEAVKAAYCPGFQQLINVAKSGKIGDIVDVEASLQDLQTRFQENVQMLNMAVHFWSLDQVCLFRLLS